MQFLRAPAGFRPSRIALAAALCALCGTTAAQDAPAPEAGTTLAPVVVRANADASAEGLSPAFAGGQVARGGRVGLLGTLDFMDAPFNTRSFTSETIRNQQTASVGDVLQNEPAVRVARGFGNYQQLYMVRGFPLYSDDIAYNGLYGLLPRQYLASEFVERVDVLLGANAFLNGAAPGGSGIGGAINIVPKRATAEPLTQVTAGSQSGGQISVSADVARRFGPDNSTGVRVNAVRRDGDTAVDGESGELSGVGVGLDWRNSRVRVSADVGYQDHKIKRGQPSVTFAPGVPIGDAPDASVNMAQPWTWSDERDRFGTLRAEIDLAPQVTGWAAFGARRGYESSAFSNPTVNDAAGNASAYRSEFAREDTVRTGELGVRAKFRTAGVGHTVNASANAFRSESRQAYVFYEQVNYNIYQPVEVAPSTTVAFAGGSLASPLVTEKTRTHSIALSDTLSFNEDRLLLTLGLRHQTIEASGYDYNSGALLPPVNKRSRVTPVVAGVFKATKAVSLYANYLEGLAKVPSAGGFPVPSNAGETFKPYRSRQVEVGAKYDGGNVGAAVSVFQVTQPQAYTDVATSIYGVYGEQRNRGMELSAFGAPVRGWRLLAGLSLLDGEQIKTNGGATDGKRAIGAPKAQMTLGSEWDVAGLRGLTLDGRVLHTTSQYADAANTQKVPAWTRVDLGARYVMAVADRVVTLRARVENVADADHWTSAGGYPGSGYLVIGAPRTFVASASVDF
ncbi:TonB-dependent receptor [Rhizobacter sp. LjRoot28]|uniref:TonB-dependent receptor n=1 Tax=Rhizobacter sp. LjRoot28 TaxID=3342309 RepID=UPI003ED14344